MGTGVMRVKIIFFSEHGHVTYQTELNEVTKSFFFNFLVGLDELGLG